MHELVRAIGVAEQAARAAGDRILRGYAEDLAIAVKSDPADRVTQVDREAQAIIAGVLGSAFPEIPVLGEEDSRAGKADRAERRWIVDPLDGTTNFIQRLPHVGVSIALEQGGEPVAGVLYFPAFDRLYAATRGGGALCNGARIRVRNVGRLQDAVVAEVYSDRLHRGKEVVFPPCLAYRKYGSAVTSLAYLAEGAVDAVGLECHLWDIAAAAVIVREAGGEVEWAPRAAGGGPRSPVLAIAACPGIFHEFGAFVRRVLR